MSISKMIVKRRFLITQDDGIAAEARLEIGKPDPGGSKGD
jgi:hypothetical protein